jgi:hypothetical protein
MVHGEAWGRRTCLTVVLNSHAESEKRVELISCGDSRRFERREHDRKELARATSGREFVR